MCIRDRYIAAIFWTLAYDTIYGTQDIKDYEIIVDGSDNFNTKFLLNKYSIKYSKILIVGAISKFDGHVFTFNFKNKKTPCLKCFYQSMPSDDLLNCESEGVLGSIAGIVGNIQANEVLKEILNIGKDLKGSILILNLLSQTLQGNHPLLELLALILFQLFREQASFEFVHH